MELALHLFLLLHLLVLSLPHHAASLSFKFTSFAANDDRLNYTGDASARDGAVHLTGNHTKSAGRATYSQPLLLWDNSSSGNYLSSFSTSFSFTIHCHNDSACSDGMAFFLAATNLPFENRGDGGLGLAEGVQPSSYPFVAAEIDTYANTFDPQPLPYNAYAQIGIDVSSIISEVTKSWSDTRVKEGTSTFASVTYESSTRNLSVSVNGDEGNLVRISYVIDLRKRLPKNVAIGFSAATGNYFETHTVNSWEFNSRLEAAVQ